MHNRDIFLALCVVLITSISYNLGKINALQKTPISITGGKADVYSTSGQKETKIDKKPVILDKRIVASKNSDKYHFTWCSGAKRIKEENKIWFENESAAKSAGYVKAGNCN